MTDWIAELLRIPDEVGALASRLGDSRQYAQWLSEQRQAIAHRVAMDVASATDEAGRKLYSNEEARRAAVAARLEADEEYADLGRRAADAARRAGRMEARLEQLKYRHRSLVALAELLSEALQAGRQDIVDAVSRGLSGIRDDLVMCPQCEARYADAMSETDTCRLCGGRRVVTRQEACAYDEAVLATSEEGWQLD